MRLKIWQKRQCTRFTPNAKSLPIFCHNSDWACPWLFLFQSIYSLSLADSSQCNVIQLSRCWSELSGANDTRGYGLFACQNCKTRIPDIVDTPLAQNKYLCIIYTGIYIYIIGTILYIIFLASVTLAGPGDGCPHCDEISARFWSPPSQRQFVCMDDVLTHSWGLPQWLCMVILITGEIWALYEYILVE